MYRKTTEKYLLKTIVFLIVISVWILPKNIHAQTQIDISKVTFGQNSKEVLAQLPKPQKETVENGLKVFWYNSISPTHADLLYLDKDLVALKSFVVTDEKLRLADVIVQYGKPEASLEKEYGSVKTHLHIWETKGFALITNCKQITSAVIRKYEFIPQDYKQYLQLAGLDELYKKEISVSGEITLKSPIASSTNTYSLKIFDFISQLPFAILLTVGILVSLLMFYFYKLKHK